DRVVEVLHPRSRPAESIPASPTPIERQHDPLTGAFALELGDRRDDPERHPTRWRRRVQSFSDGHEPDVKRPEFIKERHEMPHIAPEAIQLPADHGVEPAPPD